MRNEFVAKWSTFVRRYLKILLFYVASAHQTEYFRTHHVHALSALSRQVVATTTRASTGTSY